MDVIEVLKAKTEGMPDQVVITITTQQGRALIDQLEAERQLIDRLGKELREVERLAGNELAEHAAEIAALKGDQVPVAWIRERTIDKPEHNGKVWRDISYPAKPEPAAVDGVYHDVIIPLYDRPQKPVVSELISMLKSEIVHAESNDIRLPKRLGEKVGRVAIPVDYLKAAIEAAGGFVKDGE